MIRFLFIILLLLSFTITTPYSAQASLLNDNWLSREYNRFRTYPRLDRAYKKIKAEQYDEALLLLYKILEIEPAQVEANQVLLQVCFELKDYNCVINQATKWKNITPNTPIADYYAALAYQQTGQQTQAIQQAESAYQHNSLGVERRIVMGRLLIDELINSGNAQEAIKWRMKTQNETPFISKTDILDWAGQLSERGFYSDADTLYKLLPTDVSVVGHRVALLEKWNKPEEAAHLLEGLSNSSVRYTPEYWLQLAHLYQKSGHTDEEFQTLRRGIATVKNDKTLYKALLNRLIKLEKLSEAVNLAQEALAQHGNNPNLRSTLVELLIANKKYELALEHVRVLMQDTHVNSNTLRVQLTFLLTQTKQWGELAELRTKNFYRNENYEELLGALHAYSLAADDLKYRKLLEANFPFTQMPPKHRDYLTLELLKLHLAENQKDKAKAMVRSLIQDDLLSQSIADQLLNSAQETGQCNFAVPFAEKLMMRGTATGRAYLVAGYCLAESKPGLALEYLLEADKRDILPSEKKALNRSVGYLYAEGGNTTKALSSWKLYFQENQSDIDTSLSAVLLALSEKEYELARTIFANLETKAKIPDQMATYLYALGLQAQQQESLIQAKAFYETSNSLSKSAEIYYLLAQINRQLQDENAALKALNEAIKISPQNSVYLAERGYLRANMNDTEGAIEDFTQSYNLVPNRTVLLPEIAYNELKRGNRKASIPWFYKAVDAADSYPPATKDGETKEEKLFKLRRTIQTLEDQWAFNLTAVIRLDEYSQDTLFIPPVAFASYGGFYSGEVSYRIDDLPIKTQNGRIQFFARFLQGTKDQSLKRLLKHSNWDLVLDIEFLLSKMYISQLNGL